MRVRVTKRGAKQLSKLDPARRRAAEEALKRFLDNPRSPGLHFERLKRDPKLHTIRIDRGFRIMFRETDEPDLLELIDAGSHDIY